MPSRNGSEAYGEDGRLGAPSPVLSTDPRASILFATLALLPTDDSNPPLMAPARPAMSTRYWDFHNDTSPLLKKYR